MFSCRTNPSRLRSRSFETCSFSPIGALSLSINRTSRVAVSNTSSFPTERSPLTQSRMREPSTWT